MDGQKCAVDPATDQKVADDWSDNTCRSTPDADWCKGVCICPKLKPAAKPSVTPAANNPKPPPVKRAGAKRAPAEVEDPNARCAAILQQLVARLNAAA